jgi:hypothetical protein
MIKRLFLLLALPFFTYALVFAKAPNSEPTSATAQYMANEGLMVVQGEAKVVFIAHLKIRTVGYVQDERYIAIEHMDVRRDCFGIVRWLVRG